MDPDYRLNSRESMCIKAKELVITILQSSDWKTLWSAGAAGVFFVHQIHLAATLSASGSLKHRIMVHFYSYLHSKDAILTWS